MLIIAATGALVGIYMMLRMIFDISPIILRVALCVAIITACGIAGGFYGAFAGFMICGLLGVLFPAPMPAESNTEACREEWDEVRTARRGSEVDPTRPTKEDYRAMAAENFNRRYR